MKPISGIVNSISELIGQLTLPTREKKELEIGLLKLIQELERELTQARAVTVQEEVNYSVVVEIKTGIVKFVDDEKGKMRKIAPSLEEFIKGWEPWV